MEARNHNQKWVINVKSLKLIPLNQFADKYDLSRVAALINHPSLLRNSVIETEKIEGFDNREKLKKNVKLYNGKNWKRDNPDYAS